MDTYSVLQKIPKNGFLKTTRPQSAPLTSVQKSALIRRGNELFNKNQIDQAKKIFLTTGYSDGLSRIGDYYFKNNNTLEALRMYMMAPAPEKKEKVIEKLAGIVQFWLHEKN
jgi:hypothetical protein